MVCRRVGAHSGNHTTKALPRKEDRASTAEIQGEHPGRRATRERNFAMQATAATPSPEKGAHVVPAPNVTRWIGIGLLGLALYGALTFFSSLDPQPDFNTHLEAWSRFVTTDYYALSHLFTSGLGTILAIFGTVALGAYLTRSRAGRMGLWAMVIAVFSHALFLMIGGTSTFSAPFEGQIVLAGMEEIEELPTLLATTLQGLTQMAAVVLGFVGNVLLGVAVWRSGILPKWAGALWAFAPVLMYVLGMVYGMTIGGNATPPTVPAGAVLLVISGVWMAWRVLHRPSAAGAVGVGAKPSVH